MRPRAALDHLAAGERDGHVAANLDMTSDSRLGEAIQPLLAESHDPQSVGRRFESCTAHHTMFSSAQGSEANLPPAFRKAMLCQVAR